MPLIALKLDHGLYAAVQSLVADRDSDYSDIQQVIEVALRNHLQLEQRYRGAGGRVAEIPDDQWARRSRSPRSTRETMSADPLPGHAISVDAKSDATWNQVVAPFRLSSEQTAIIEPCKAVSRPPEEQMYALVNRLFPLKLVARWIDARANEIGHWPMATEVFRRLGHDLDAFGSALARCDAIANRRRDDQLATSLPRMDNPKSSERFLTQFVARQTDGGDIYPAGIVQFALACLKNGQLVLSREGQQLSRLPNVLIDDTGEKASEVLSSDERTLFLGQIQNYMPSEGDHLRAVLRAVSSGSTSPTQLVEELRGQFAGRATRNAFRSHLSGVIARAIDLRLLHRRWEGRFVFYSLSDIAIALLAGSKSGGSAQTTAKTQLL